MLILGQKMGSDLGSSKSPKRMASDPKRLSCFQASLMQQGAQTPLC